jgi:two-component system, cell cycle sensor histidine kinase and response regulator CckA
VPLPRAQRWTRSDHERTPDAPGERERHLESLGIAIGGIAHDFNTLLMAASTELGMAEDALARGEPTRVPELVHQARRAIDRATALTGKLMTFTGRGDLQLDVADLCAAIDAAIKELPAPLRSTIDVDHEDPSALRRLWLDAAAITDVVQCLLTNAHEARHDGTTIRVRSGVVRSEAAPSATFVADGAPAGAYGFVDVEDDGKGIEPDVLPRVFDPFFSTKFAGRGLGLSLAFGVVRAHRGAIDVASSPGQGTRVRLLFPLAGTPAPGVRADAQPSPPVAADPRHILVVDDEELLRSALREALVLRGFTVDLAENGEQALACLAPPLRYAAVVLDVTMPVMGGHAALRELRRIHPTLPVVLASGYADGHVDPALASAGPTVFLHKPFGTRDLLAALAALTGGPTDR